MSFGRQQGGFEVWIAAEAAEAAACGNDPMIGKLRLSGGPEHVADGPRRARPSGQARDVAVGRHTAGRDAPEHVQHASRERGHPVGPARGYCLRAQ
jgi:hypothetical protein